MCPSCAAARDVFDTALNPPSQPPTHTAHRAKNNNKQQQQQQTVYNDKTSSSHFFCLLFFLLLIFFSHSGSSIFFARCFVVSSGVFRIIPSRSERNVCFSTSVRPLSLCRPDWYSPHLARCGEGRGGGGGAWGHLSLGLTFFSPSLFLFFSPPSRSARVKRFLFPLQNLRVSPAPTRSPSGGWEKGRTSPATRGQTESRVVRSKVPPSSCLFLYCE